MQSHSLGQLLLVGVPGPELDRDTACVLRKVQPGGFILFGRNIVSPAQLRKLIDDLRDLSQVEPIITIDQEGGRVSRLRLIGQEPPNAQALSAKGDMKAIWKHGDLTGRLLRFFGFNLDLCPVLDIDLGAERDNSLRGRCYGKDPQEVISKAGVFNSAMRRQGILSCGKHFPGYAYAAVDPHHKLPTIERTREQLEAEELVPFRTLLPELDSIMVGHSHYPCFEPDRAWPASLSPNVIRGLLRNQWGYEGLVMTDDLDMGAVLEEVVFRAVIVQAIEAGNDMAMICHRFEVLEEALAYLGEAPAPLLHDALERVYQLKKRLAPAHSYDEVAFEKINREIWDLRVEVLGAEEAAKRSPEDGKRSPVELY